MFVQVFDDFVRHGVLSVHGSVCLFVRVFPVCCFLSVLGLLRM